MPAPVEEYEANSGRVVHRGFDTFARSSCFRESGGVQWGGGVNATWSIAGAWVRSDTLRCSPLALPVRGYARICTS